MSDQVLANHFRGAALVAARRGWSVFPLRPNSKVPAIKRWEQRATTDEAQINRWWSGESTGNVGVACGPSNLVVVDLDAAHGEQPDEEWAGAEHGRDVLARLAQTAGQPYPADTYTVQTPSGGEHLYFAAPPDVALHCSMGLLGWRVDTRARGGAVVAAGSLRRCGAYRPRNTLPVAPLPQWLVDKLTPRPNRPHIARDRMLPEPRAGAYVRAIVHSEASKVADARHGRRHATLLRAAVALGRLVAAGELGERDARAALHEAATGHIGYHTWTRSEAERTITDGLAYGARRPRRITHQPN